MLGPLAQAEGQPVQLDAALAARARHEQLHEVRHDGAGARPGVRGVDRDLAPAEDRQALLRRDLLDHGGGDPPGLAVDGQEGHAHGEVSWLGQGEVHVRAQEAVGDLCQDPRTVTGVGLAALGTSVVEIAQGRQSLHDDSVATSPVHVRDHRDTTGVMLVRGVVKTLGLGEPEVGSRH
ncbi:hypothetical protein GCM10020219_027520 [Nonomuraea dietziae]